MLEELAPRKKGILYAVVNDHIVSAAPVGSLQIASKKGVHLSSATVRAVMAELEERGYLKKSHTSSGRIPTDLAYRVYVDQLLELRPPNARDRSELKEGLVASLGDFSDLPQRSSRVLSSILHRPGIATDPKPDARRIEHIQFRKLRGRLVLVILVSSSGHVENKILKLARNLKQSDLDQMHGYLNGQLAGLTIAEARRRVLLEIQDEKAQYDLLVRDALTLSRETLAEAAIGVHVEGSSSLLEATDGADFGRMQRILRRLEEKTALAGVLDDCLRSPGVKILIGDEVGGGEIDGLSLITAPYSDAEGNRGLLGVLGPSRADYARIIPLVEYTSHLLTNVLQESRL